MEDSSRPHRPKGSYRPRTSFDPVDPYDPSPTPYQHKPMTPNARPHERTDFRPPNPNHFNQQQRLDSHSIPHHMPQRMHNEAKYPNEMRQPHSNSQNYNPQQSYPRRNFDAAPQRSNNNHHVMNPDIVYDKF